MDLTTIREKVCEVICPPRAESETETRGRHEAYREWIGHLKMIEYALTTQGEPDEQTIALARNMGLLVFPLIDTISQTLFKGGPRKYLRKLGYTNREADLMITIFRNGQIHDLKNRRLVYDNGVVHWALHSTAGTSGLPKTGRNAFTYYRNTAGVHLAHIELHWLVPQIREDLEARLDADPENQIKIIVGQRIRRKRPKAELLDDASEVL